MSSNSPLHSKCASAKIEDDDLESSHGKLEHRTIVQQGRDSGGEPIEPKREAVVGRSPCTPSKQGMITQYFSVVDDSGSTNRQASALSSTEKTNVKSETNRGRTEVQARPTVQPIAGRTPAKARTQEPLTPVSNNSRGVKRPMNTDLDESLQNTPLALRRRRMEARKVCVHASRDVENANHGERIDTIKCEIGGVETTFVRAEGARCASCLEEL